MTETKIELSGSCRFTLTTCEYSDRKDMSLDYTEHSTDHWNSDTETSIDIDINTAREIVAFMHKSFPEIEQPAQPQQEPTVPATAYDRLFALNEANAARIIELEAAQAEQEPVDKNGSPCPEFWDWLPKAYNFDGNGAFTKYNMEVAFLAGKQASQPAQQEPVAWMYTRIGHPTNPHFIEAGKVANELRVGVSLDGGGHAIHPSKDHTDWVPLYTSPPAQPASAPAPVPAAKPVGPPNLALKGSSDLSKPSADPTPSKSPTQ